MQHALCEAAPDHRSVSVRHITGAGHLAVQQRPDDVAHTVACVLEEDTRRFRQPDEMMQPMRARL
jgi:hypothetical protein